MRSAERFLGDVFDTAYFYPDYSTELAARELMLHLFGRAVFQQYLRHHCIVLEFKLGKRSYTARVHHSHVTTRRRLGPVKLWRTRHCIGIRRHYGLPRADQVITMALRIKCNPKAFFREANPGL